MSTERKITKTEGWLLAITALFLCSLLMLSARDRMEMQRMGVETDRTVPQEQFLPDLTPLDLNKADAEDLEKLPGIGEVLAQRILAYRDAQGGFRHVEDLLNVSGIGEKTLEELEGRVTVNGG